MSYLVLARKWRPQTFDQVVGQQPVVRTLQNALKRNRVAHAMLFSGVRGVGKTTLARLMAKALNCRGEESERPCNECDSCREIMAGNAMDLHEIDGASNRGIQEIRELKENIRFLPTTSKYKIIIIDEVHMLTTEAFNALLKTLEEPPAHVYFMFATTELHKIPITILSRCQRYELKRVPFVELVSFFAKVAKEEGVDIADQALEMIGREAEGSVRDGLSLLDQIFAFGGEAITAEDVTQVLGLVDRQVFERLARALLAADLEQCLALFDQSYNAGIDLKRFANDLLGYFRALMICKISARAGGLLDLSDREMTVLREIADGNSAETLYNCFNLLLKGIEEMQYSSRPRMVLEMAFIKATQAGQIAPVASLLARLDDLLASPDGMAVEPYTADATQDNRHGTAEPGPADMPASSSVSVQTTPLAMGKKTERPEASHNMEPAAAESKPEIQTHEKDVRAGWEDFVGYVRERKPWMAPALALAESAGEEGNDLVLRFDDDADCKVLQQPENAKLVTEFAQDFFQKELKLKLVVRGGGSNGGADENGESPREERRALANDPLVRMTTEIFDGQVAGIRTGPRSR